MRPMSRMVLAVALAMLGMAVAAWDAIRLQQQAARRSPAVQAQVMALLDLAARGRAWTAEERVSQVNGFFNRRVDWREDTEVWGRVDYWASPMEMFEKGAGDCEDIAMGKYFTLLGMGLPPTSLRMVYVKANHEGRVQAHMVLAWYPRPEAEPMILDNLNPELLPASQRRDLQPVFSFNAEGLWQGVGAQGAGNPLARLGVWRDALQRSRDEGF